MTGDRPTVIIVDDDASIRKALERLVRSVALQALSFESPKDFLHSRRPEAPSCLVLDVRFPGMNGLDFQAELCAADIHLPIIFITGHGDIPMAVRAMKAGAVEFLSKPWREQELLDAIQRALERDRARRESSQQAGALRQLFASLTGRERQVMALVVSGRPNKSIAAEIGIGEVTVKIHRRNLMHKMKARSLAELVRMADQLQLADAKSAVV
jgi:FixJ family two-component response regulator